MKFKIQFFREQEVLTSADLLTLKDLQQNQ